MPVTKQEKRRAEEVAADLKEARELLRQAEMAAEYGRRAKRGHHFVRSVMGGNVVEEADGTPFNCSVSSEHYWAS